MCHQNVRSLHTLNTSRQGFRHLIHVESTYYNDSLLLMKHCTEKVYNTRHLPIIIQLCEGEAYSFIKKCDHLDSKWSVFLRVCVHLRFENGLRFPWPSASIARALSLEGQLPFAFAWSCLFNLTQWRKAWHWPESAALMCFMFCIHHCHRAGEDCQCHRRTGKRVCLCVCVV